MTVQPTSTIVSQPKRWSAIAALFMMAFSAPLAASEPAGLVTVSSAHDVKQTLDRLAEGVRGAGWVVFGEVDHARAAQAAGLSLAPRTVMLFGNPKAGTPGMVAKPTLAIDLPMRLLVWQDEQGRTFVTRASGDDIAERVFARHGLNVPSEGRQATERFLDGLVRKAVE